MGIRLFILGVFQLSLQMFFQVSYAAPVIVSEKDLDAQYEKSVNQLLENLNHEDIRRGAVIASPSKNDPDYFYHWTRDAALVQDSLLQAYLAKPSEELSKKLTENFINWVEFEYRAQRSSSFTTAALGEPKFNVDGTVFAGPWGRPQNDGPALRALTMSKWALALIQAGRKEWVRQYLYSSDLPATKIIKTDLEYTSRNWQVPSFDLWEEVSGLHYYTLSIQKKALILGAALAEKMDDPFAGRYYREQAVYVNDELLKFTDSIHGFVIATRNQTDGWTNKKSKLDVAVVLGTLHGYLDQENLEAVAITAQNLEQNFRSLYAINKQKNLSTAIGRYPEDVYDGNGFSGGNPWFLATHAYAEFYCKLSQRNGGSLNLQQKGIGYLYRTLTHVDRRNGEMSEQYSRQNGYLMGASHLSWSYASFITAYLACLK